MRLLSILDSGILSLWMPFDVATIKSRFPIFSHHRNLVYVDNAATSQKPDSVIRSVSDFYERSNANAHRGLYKLSSEATQSYEHVRSLAAKLIGTGGSRSITFTKGTTESINVVAHGFLKRKLQQGDNVVVSAMEHHANFIPWQQVCKEKGCELRVVAVTADGEIDWQDFVKLLDSKTKLVAVTHISNVLGTINPVEKIVSICRERNIPLLIDGAQSVGHVPIDVANWDVDFLTFSGHKMFGPMGVGVLYANARVSQEIEPLILGGGGIKHVTKEDTVLLDYPEKLEAGTPNVAGVVGMGAAIEFINQLDLMACHTHVQNLGTILRSELKSLSFVSVYGPSQESSGIVSFNVAGIHPHDIASFLADRDIAVRAGHHCAQPLLDSMRVGATVRASFSIYNSKDDVQAIVAGIRDAKKFWS